MKINKPDRILFLDTETGGTNPNLHSLLSIGMVAWERGRFISEKEILINDGMLKVSNEALSINQIDIEEHKKNALKPKDAIKEFFDFTYKNFSSNSITIAGHNVHFDVNFLKRFFSDNKVEYDDLFSHRIIDTSSILYFLYLSNRLEHKIISSDSAFNYYNILVEDRHTALSDAKATAKLFNKLIESVSTEYI